MTRDEQEMIMWRRIYERWYGREVDTCGDIADAAVAEFRNTWKTYFTWEKETYPRLWRLAYDAGVEAKMQGQPRDCNLKDSQWTTPSGQILKVYKSAWEQGWDQ